LWDSIFGTNKDYYEVVEKELEVKEKGEVTKLKREEISM